MEKERKCKICNKKLSTYNNSDICFCHDHCNDYRGGTWENISQCSSRVCEGVLIVNFDYYGELYY